MNKKQLTYQTLHSHTTTSDGLLTHLEVLNVCAKNNIGVVALTDHDALPDEKSLKILKENSNHPTKWVIGIEVSSGLPKGMKGSFGGFHITGLFVDPFNKDLLEHCKKSREARIKRMEKTVKNLQSLGFDITTKECLKASEDATVGRPHIVRVLKSKEKNLKIMEEIRLRMKKDAEKDPKIKKKYDRMMKFGKHQYPYGLFLGGDSYIKDVYVGYFYHPEMDKSVSLIRNAGGLAFIAHWFTAKNEITEEVLDKLFANDKLDGAETVYGLWTGMNITRKDIDKERMILQKLVKKHKKLESGGVDAHCIEDFELFAKEKWYAKRTIGMVEKIIEKSGVETTWSSL